MYDIINDIDIIIEAIQNGDADDAVYMLKEIKHELEFKAIINGW